MLAQSGRLYGLHCRIVYLRKQSWSVSNSLSGMGHPPHRSGCESMMLFALQSCSSLRIFVGWCCLSFFMDELC